MIQEYLDSVTAAATVNTERMQKMTSTIKSKDDQLAARCVQLAEMMARLD